MEAVLMLGLVGGGIWAVISVATGWGVKRRAQWQRTCEALGLGPAHGPHYDRYIHARRHLPEHHAKLDGCDVYVGVRSYTTSNGKNSTTHYFTYLVRSFCFARASATA